MRHASLEKRVEVVENTVYGPEGVLEQLGHLRADVTDLRADVQAFRGEFLQFKGETRDEFSALRQEMRAEFVAVRHEIGEVRQEMRAEFVAVRSEMNTRFEDVDRRFDGLQAGLDQTRTEMRVLHEEVISRISLLGERLHGSAGS